MIWRRVGRIWPAPLRPARRSAGSPPWPWLHTYRLLLLLLLLVSVASGRRPPVCGLERAHRLRWRLWLRLRLGLLGARPHGHLHRVHGANLLALYGERVRHLAAPLGRAGARRRPLGLGGRAGRLLGRHTGGRLGRGGLLLCEPAGDVDEHLHVHLVGQAARAGQSYLEHLVAREACDWEGRWRRRWVSCWPRTCRPQTSAARLRDRSLN